jgi:mono/diheme cytochrome c family protein
VKPAFLALLLPGLTTLHAAAAAVDFNHQIVPILRKHCAECHTGDKLKGGFSMNDRAALLHGGENGKVVDFDHPEKSHLLEVVTTQDEDLRMPPKGDGLTSAEADLIRRWISEGLPWEPGFAFQAPAYEPPLKPRAVSLPPVVEGREHPVDRLMDAYFAKKGFTRPALVNDSTFLRRAYLDLIGLLPTPAEVSAFLQDPAADKRERLIDALLSRDVDYTEHWLTFWNDLLRNDYGGTGFITGGRKQISKWLYESLIENKPFDQFARELIAPSSDQSTGFIDGIKWRGEVSAGQTVEIQFAQSLGQSFLGINLKCASCHDSFTDRWKLDEAYGLAAIYAERPLEVHRCDKPVGRQAQAAWLFPELGQIDASAPRPQRLTQLAALMTHPENGRFTRTLVNRLWHRLLGYGIVHPLDAMQSEPWHSDLLDYLAHDFQSHGYDIKHSLRRIATSQMYQAQSEVFAKAEDASTFRAPRARRLSAEQFVDAVWQLTGTAPSKIDAPVFRGKQDPNAAKTFPMTGQWIWGSSAANGQPPPAGETLIFRANWNLSSAATSGAAIVTCDNAFVLYLNGRKILTGDDWSKVTALPLHDQLKQGNNQIVIIATNAGNGPNAAGLYFQAQAQLADGSTTTFHSDTTDWQFSPEAPAGKEGRLGALPKTFHPVTPVKALTVWTQALASQGPGLLAQGASAARHPVRAALVKSDFLMRSLGRPNRDQIVSMRPDDLTTLEALDLANGATLTQALEAGAVELLKQTWPTPGDLIRHLYAHTLARQPTTAELTAAQDLLGPQPQLTTTADLLWALLMQPEFLYVQ